jgi:transcriptional regulator GlxA family with amidase domain
MTTDTPSRHFAFILAEEFSMFCVSAVIDVLRTANMVSGTEYYHWSTVSHDGEPVRASNGLTLKPAYSAENLPPADMTFVVASLTLDFPGRQKIVNALRTLGRRGASLGALSVGSHILAQAGQLEGHRCTIHWENRAGFREAFPHIECTSNVYEIDRKRYTAAGGTTGIDLMLEIVRADFGAEITNKVANNFQYERIRSHEDRQRVGREPDLTGKSEKLRRLTELMADNLEEPLSAGVLAQSVELSVRQVERLFLKHLESTPGRYYMTLRLERARQLLRQTNIPILEVALSTGFTSHSYFAQSYRMQFGRAPSDERRKSF